MAREAYMGAARSLIFRRTTQRFSLHRTAHRRASRTLEQVLYQSAMTTQSLKTAAAQYLLATVWMGGARSTLTSASTLQMPWFRRRWTDTRTLPITASPASGPAWEAKRLTTCRL